MRTLALLIALLAIPLQAAHAQETDAPEGAVINSAQVSGLDLARLSPGLQEEIGKLAGMPLSREHLKKLAQRIEDEQPRYVAAVRAVTDPGGDVRVVFVVARLRDQDREGNINARYIVEQVNITGVPDSQISQALRDDLQTLVGRRLDSDEAERLENLMEEALPRYDVSRRIVRGSRPGQIKLVYEARKKESARWLHFETLNSNVVYHSEQGWGSNLNLPISGRDFRFTPLIAIDNGDDLIEEYSGWGLRFETRKLGAERLGASLAWSSFDQTWRSATLTALALDPGIPGTYETRSTLTPMVTFALTPDLRVSAGVGISELERVSGSDQSQMANAAIAAVGYDRRWKDAAGGTHVVDATFTMRAGSRALESDLVYSRYLGQGRYFYRRGKHRVLVFGMAGGITGDAPLFERFSLGDSTTLRGWDKYGIAPAGGDRMVHSSLEYRYQGLALFLDSGSVWDHGTESRYRVATGLGFNAGPAFFTVGFPLNTDRLTAVFTMGLRFTGAGMQQ